MLNLGMLHDNGSGTNIFKADQFFQKKMVRGTNIFSENFGPRTIISGTNFPVTGQLAAIGAVVQGLLDKAFAKGQPQSSSESGPSGSGERESGESLAQGKGGGKGGHKGDRTYSLARKEGRGEITSAERARTRRGQQWAPRSQSSPTPVYRWSESWAVCHHLRPCAGWGWDAVMPRGNSHQKIPKIPSHPSSPGLTSLSSSGTQLEKAEMKPARYLVAKGLPTLPTKLVEKVWNLEYVEMEEFLPMPRALRIVEQGNPSYSLQDSLVGALNQFQAIQQHKSQRRAYGSAINTSTRNGAKYGGPSSHGAAPSTASLAQPSLARIRYPIQDGDGGLR